MATLTNPLSLQIGQYVRFTCHHPTDLTVYEGKILGKVTFDVAKSMESDLVPYYREVAKVHTDLAPYDTLSYYILEYLQGGTSIKVVRAAEWINASSLIVTDPDLHFDIRIYERDKDDVGDVILDLLRANNYIVGYTPNS